MLDYIKLATPFLPSPKMVYDDIRNDQKIKTSYSLCSKAISHKHKKSRLKQRLKLEAIRNQLIDCKLAEWCKKIHTIIGIKNHLIKNYFILNYDEIIRELDNLLEKPSKKISNMVLEHFSSFNKYLNKYKGETLQRAKAIQYHTYFTKRGVYRFHSRIGREFYIRTGTPPFSIV